MSPAFSSPRQAAGFAALLLALLLLPALVPKSALPPRSEIYAAIPRRFGDFPYIHQQIFDETGPIDIAFVGSSRVLTGIDTPLVQRQLSARLGRPAVVRTLSWFYEGYDAVYFITRDLLEHRAVRMLVIGDEYVPSLEAPHNPIARALWSRFHLAKVQALFKGPHVLASRWFRYADGEGALAGLPLMTKASYYAAAVLGMPRNLLGLVRSNIPGEADPSHPDFLATFYHTGDPALRLGSLAVRLGYPDSSPAAFADYTPHGSAVPSDACVYSDSTTALFQFTGPPTPPLQLHFARSLAAAATSSSLVLLHLPTPADTRSGVIREREFWPDALHSNIAMAGIPPAKLFGGLSDEEVTRLFFDPVHLNENGQEFFTPLITPTLIHLYDSQTTDTRR